MAVRISEIPSQLGSASSAVAAARAPAPSQNAPLETITLSGVRIHSVTETQCIEYIVQELGCGRGGMVVTPNLDHLRRCHKDLSYRTLVSEADLVVADGMPLLWAAKLQGTPLPQRVAGSDLIWSLSEAAARCGQSLFLLGGAPGTAEAAGKVLSERYPGLKVVGTLCPDVGFENDSAAMRQIAAALVTSRPDIVFVALGSPKQELLIKQMRDTLPAAWWLGVGVSFSFVCGDVRRAPRWMQQTGLEWVHRLVQEPGRLFKRYITQGIPFAAMLLGSSALRGLGQRVRPSLKKEPKVAQLVVEKVTPAASPKTIRTPASLPSQAALSKLRALVLLGGGVRPSPLTQATGRSILDLPLDKEGPILAHWLKHAREVAELAGIEQLPVRLLVNRASPLPQGGSLPHYGTLRVEVDSSEYRGSGGVLGDLSKDYADDDLILIASAAQVLMEPLADLTEALNGYGGYVNLVSHADGTPSGLMLVTCKTLRLIPALGFVDMKEQALPLIASNYDVRVMQRTSPTGMPVRSLADYVAALRNHHRRLEGKPTVDDPLHESWESSFALIEPGAVVDPTARVHDSVVLRGGTLEAGAVLVRSIVCHGATVRRDRPAVDQVISGI